jgi:hypothetical protein
MNVVVIRGESSSNAQARKNVCWPTKARRSGVPSGGWG